MVWAGAADDFKLALKAANLDFTGFFKTGLLTFFFCWYKQLQGLLCIGGWGVNKTFHSKLSTKGLGTEHWKVTSVGMWNVQNRFRKSKNKTISFKSNPNFPRQAHLDHFLDWFRGFLHPPCLTLFLKVFKLLVYILHLSQNKASCWFMQIKKEQCKLLIINLILIL